VIVRRRLTEPNTIAINIPRHRPVNTEDFKKIVDCNVACILLLERAHMPSDPFRLSVQEGRVSEGYIPYNRGIAWPGPLLRPYFGSSERVVVARCTGLDRA
jgi:hypothetical protein